MADIAIRVKALVMGKLDLHDERQITPEASYTNDLGADSLDKAELVMEFEKEFNVAIADDAAEKMTTVGETIEWLEDNTKE